MEQICSSSSNGSHSYETDSASLEGVTKNVHGYDVLTSLEARVDVLYTAEQVESEGEGQLLRANGNKNGQ